MSLTASERETVVNMSDADGSALITTYQRRRITSLRRNPAAVLLSEGKHDGTAWAEFRLPARLVNFRAPRVVNNPETLEKLRANVAKARASRSDSLRNVNGSEANSPGPTSGVGGGV